MPISASLRKRVFQGRCICIILMMFCDTAFAQSDDSEFDELLALSLDELLELNVSSATKFQTPVKLAPAVMNLITAEQINQYAWQSINDVLYRLPSFGPGKDFDRPTVPARGAFDSWSNNHLLHLIDGIPINDNLYGSAYTWEITPIDWISSLEVIRGPGSALYGSSATNGVVQMNSLNASDLQSNVKLGLSKGGKNQTDNHLLTGFASPRLDLLVGLNHFKTDGNEYLSVDGSGRVASDQTLAQFTTNDSRENTALFGKLTLLDTLKGLSLYYLYQDWRYETNFGWLWWIPDEAEDMQEDRVILALKYNTGDERSNWEYILRYQKHNISWDTKYYPDGAFDDYYPDGVWEQLKSDGQDLFGRIQYSLITEHNDSFLIGVEADYFTYDGDELHQGNFDVDAPGAPPFSQNEYRSFGPWLDYIFNQPLLNTAVYTQYVSHFGLPKTQFTLGARWDRMAFDFRDIDTNDVPVLTRTFSRLSPRVAVVHQYSPNLVLKLIAGKAFRTPMPTELAGAHTFSLASNIKQLEPEVLTNVDVALDWQVNPQITLRTTLFWTSFENQIAFSTANNNLSTNVFSLDTAGIESEILFEWKRWDGFFNLSFTDKVDEVVLDNTISLEKDNLTWEPNWKLNFGLTYTSSRWLLSVSGHYHGKVTRRSSELGPQELPLGVGVNLDLNDYRHSQLDDWVTLDVHLRYRVNESIELGMYSTNVMNSNDQFLAKTGSFPFDYRQPDRQTQVYLNLKF